MDPIQKAAHSKQAKIKFIQFEAEAGIKGETKPLLKIRAKISPDGKYLLESGNSHTQPLKGSNVGFSTIFDNKITANDR